MFASVRKYAVDAERVDELMHRVDEKFAPRLEQMPGLWPTRRSTPARIAAERAGCSRSPSAATRMPADRSAEIAAEFVRDELSDLKIERLEAATGSVSVNRAVSEVLEDAHA